MEPIHIDDSLFTLMLGSIIVGGFFLGVAFSGRMWKWVAKRAVKRFDRSG